MATTVPGIQKTHTDAQVIDQGMHAVGSITWYIVTATDTQQNVDTLAQFRTHADALVWATKQAAGMGYAYQALTIS